MGHSRSVEAFSQGEGQGHLRDRRFHDAVQILGQGLAYDVRFGQDIPRKGEILCKFAEFWFEQLQVPSHFVRRTSDTEMEVRRMDMLPIECVVRGYFYGSLADRWRRGEASLPRGTDTRLAARLPEPVFDPTTKSEHDTPVDRAEAVGTGLVTDAQFSWLKETSIGIYHQMTRTADAAGFILADLKLEFGVLDGRIVLGDSIGPDEYRLWPKDSFEIGTVQGSYDKQILRDWLTANGYQDQFADARRSGTEPAPPQIPAEIVSKMTSRYVAAYERIAGKPL